jgi:hypothetical protein
MSIDATFNVLSQPSDLNGTFVKDECASIPGKPDPGAYRIRLTQLMDQAIIQSNYFDKKRGRPVRSLQNISGMTSFRDCAPQPISPRSRTDLPFPQSSSSSSP